MKRLLPLLLLLTLPMAGACHRQSQSGTVQAVDGTPIRYESRGKGDTALVFIHCWSCNRHYWDGQLKDFEKDFQVVTLDLGGHGESGKGRTEWKVEGLVQDVTAVIDRLNLKRVILIGHSMGGPLALMVATARPEQVAGVVCVDTLQDVEAPPPTAMMEQAAQQMESDLPKVVGELLPNFFPKGADPKVVAWVIEQASKADPKVAAGLMRDMAHADLKPRMAAVKVPIRCISSGENLMGFKTKPEINRKYADFEVIEMSGVGHFPQLEKPSEFNGWLRQILEQLD